MKKSKILKLDLKLYRGYVNNQELVVYGHLFKSWAPDKYRLDRKGIKHAVAIIHMFRISPLKNREITLKFRNTTVTTKTLDDGYFRFTIPFSEELKSGWHEYEVSCNIKDFGMIEKGELLKPHPSKYGIISDIDDTFRSLAAISFFGDLTKIIALTNPDLPPLQSKSPL